MGIRPPGTLCLECKEPITVQRFRVHPECDRDRKNRLKRERRASKPKVVVLFDCEVCGESTERLCRTQVTCQDRECKRALQTVRDGRRKAKKTALPSSKCRQCRRVFDPRAVTQFLCGRKVCALARQRWRQKRARRIKRKENPNICLLCDEAVTDGSTKEYHPECYKTIRYDDKRVRREIAAKRNAIMCEVCEEPMRYSTQTMHAACRKQNEADRRRMDKLLPAIKDKKINRSRRVPRRSQQPDIELREVKILAAAK